MLVFPGEGTYVHYQDNGSDFAYQGGAYNQYAFTQRGKWGSDHEDDEGRL